MSNNVFSFVYMEPPKGLIDPSLLMILTGMILFFAGFYLVYSYVKRLSKDIQVFFLGCFVSFALLLSFIPFITGTFALNYLCILGPFLVCSVLGLVDANMKFFQKKSTLSRVLSMMVIVLVLCLVTFSCLYLKGSERYKSRVLIIDNPFKLDDGFKANHFLRGLNQPVRYLTDVIKLNQDFFKSIGMYEYSMVIVDRPNCGKIARKCLLDNLQNHFLPTGGLVFMIPHDEENIYFPCNPDDDNPLNDLLKYYSVPVNYKRIQRQPRISSGRGASPVCVDVTTFIENNGMSMGSERLWEIKPSTSQPVGTFPSTKVISYYNQNLFETNFGAVISGQFILIGSFSLISDGGCSTPDSVHRFAQFIGSQLDSSRVQSTDGFFQTLIIKTLLGFPRVSDYSGIDHFAMILSLGNSIACTCVFLINVFLLKPRKKVVKSPEWRISSVLN